MWKKIANTSSLSFLFLLVRFLKFNSLEGGEKIKKKKGLPALQDGANLTP